MDNLTLIQSLDEAIRIISAARTAGKLAAGSSAIWRIADHAENHLDKQIKDLLAPPAEIAAPAQVERAQFCSGRCTLESCCAGCAAWRGVESHA
jgi:pyruvate/2-oxoglutarate/acetoin dehydrogenase E1 component